MKLKIIPLAFLLALAACEKEDELKNYDACTNIIEESPDQILVSAEDEDIAERLFEINEIDSKNLQVFKVQVDEKNNTHVRCYQFLNGLKIFAGDVIFHFNGNDEFYFLSGDLITHSSLNNKGSLASDILKNKFLARVEKDDFYNSKVQEYAKYFLDFQLGYSNYYGSTGSETEKLIKVWKITPHDQEYPVLFVDDETAKNLYYFNGIIIN